MKRSPDRSTFQMQAYIDRCQDNGEQPREEYLELYRSEIQQDLDNQNDPEWRKHNLEYDLRSTDWICAKVTQSEKYAQNLYAALCNNEFVCNQVWPLLKHQTWGCSWRYAGGIVAHMREQGDYIDWYCSGIRGQATAEDLAAMTQEQRAQYDWYQKNFVSESVVTDEIRQDLFRLGWIVVKDQDHD